MFRLSQAITNPYCPMPILLTKLTVGDRGNGAPANQRRTLRYQFDPALGVCVIIAFEYSVQFAT